MSPSGTVEEQSGGAEEVPGLQSLWEIDAFFLKDFRLEWFESRLCLGCADAALKLVPVVTCVVGS